MFSKFLLKIYILKTQKSIEIFIQNTFGDQFFSINQQKKANFTKNRQFQNVLKILFYNLKIEKLQADKLAHTHKGRRNAQKNRYGKRRQRHTEAVQEDFVTKLHHQEKRHDQK